MNAADYLVAKLKGTDITLEFDLDQRTVTLLWRLQSEHQTIELYEELRTILMDRLYERDASTNRRDTMTKMPVSDDILREVLASCKNWDDVNEFIEELSISARAAFGEDWSDPRYDE
jgi:hypothetical protein